MCLELCLGKQQPDAAECPLVAWQTHGHDKTPGSPAHCLPRHVTSSDITLSHCHICVCVWTA